MQNRAPRARLIPCLPAERVGDQLRVWCCHCRRWHYHGAAGGGGHRVAHCIREDSPYRRGGYVLVLPDGDAGDAA